MAKKGYDIARRGGVVAAVQQDIKVVIPCLVSVPNYSLMVPRIPQSLLDIVQKNVSRAERDNDLIYHQDVPPTSALPAIQEVSMVQPLTEPGLQDPKAVIGADGVIFGELLGWGAQLAIGTPSILYIYKLRLTRHGCSNLQRQTAELDSGRDHRTYAAPQ